MITSSGLPVGFDASVEALFLAEGFRGACRLVVGAVGHPIDVLDEGVGDVESRRKGNLEALAHGEVGT